MVYFFSLKKGGKPNMTQPISTLALFRLSVLGPLTSRDKLERGELRSIIRELASKTYAIPASRRVHINRQTIEAWYYAWQAGGIEALAAKTRCDKGHSTVLSQAVQTALLDAKKENPARSINTLIDLLVRQGTVAKNTLSRATVHRFLQHHHVSQRLLKPAITIERRSFVSHYAGDLWQGDVLHGPSVLTKQGQRKAYLVSLMDDASRLICHSHFCLGETALDIEGVLKEALLKRGVPKKLLIDNGPAYRSESLQGICARLGIRLIYSRPYEPESKGKLERYHRTFREQFLSEIATGPLLSLEDLNARLWAFTEQVYHQCPHAGLEGKTPLERFREDLLQLQPLGQRAVHLEDLFYHRVKRTVRQDGTLVWEGHFFEVPYECSGQKVILVFDPHLQKPVRIETFLGTVLGAVTPLDKQANLYRERQRPLAVTQPATPKACVNRVELAHQEFIKRYSLNTHQTSTP
jgi:putative transposase